MFAGVVRDVQRYEPSEGDRERWTFRVERYDSSGNRRAPIPVELRARSLSRGSISGALSDGDEVRVTGTWIRGTLHVKAVNNLTTGAQVSGKAVGALAKVVGVFAIIFFSLVVSWVGYGFFQAITGGFSGP